MYNNKYDPLKDEAISMYDVWDLHAETEIGDEVEFYVNTYEINEKTGRHKDMKILVKGKVKRKFTYIFELEDGRTFQWKQYLLGKVK